MAKDPGCVSQYPGIASCLPGGPTIDLGGGGCVFSSIAGPLEAEAASGLTSSSQVTVTSAGCFHPGACPKPTEPAAAPVKPTAEPAVVPSAPQRSQPVSNGNAEPAASPNPPPAASPNPQPASQPGPAPVASANAGPTVISNPNNVAPDQLSALHADLTAPSVPPPASPAANPQGQGTGPAAPPAQSPGLGAMIAGAMGGPAPPNGPSYTVEIAPSASALIINGVTTHLPVAQPAITPTPQVISVGSQTFTLQPVAPVPANGQSNAPQYVVGSQTIVPGGPAATIANTPIIIPSAGTQVHIGSSTFPLAPPTATNNALPPLIINSQTFIPNSASAYIIAGQTLTPGASAIVIPGSPTTMTPLTVGSQVFTPNPTGFSIAGTSISAGGPGVTIAGTVVSLPSKGGELVLGSSTIALASVSQSVTPVTIGSLVFTPNPTTFIVGGSPVTAGGKGVTVGGEVVSLEGGGELVVGSSTFALAFASSVSLSEDFTSNTSVTNAKSSGGAGATRPTSSSTPTGGACRTRGGIGVVVMMVVGGWGMVMVV